MLGDGGAGSPTNYGYFYALNTTPGNVPINQPPAVASWPSRSPNTNVERSKPVEVVAAQVHGRRAL